MFKVEAAMLKVDLALLRCPITLRIMSDPVTASDGNTYERTAITEWRKKSACSPLTNETMSSTKLFPNRAIKNIIDIYLAEEKKAAAGAGAAAVQGSDISASTQPDARVVLLKKLKEKTEERARLAREAGEKAEAARLIYDEAKKEFQDLKQLTLSDDESDTDDRIQVLALVAKAEVKSKQCQVLAKQAYQAFNSAKAKLEKQEGESEACERYDLLAGSWRPSVSVASAAASAADSDDEDSDDELRYFNPNARKNNMRC